MSRHRSHPLITLLAVLVGPVTTACTAVADTAHGPEALRSDSAGVEIILNPGAALTAPVFATLDSVPALRIGTLDGMPEEQFGAIRDVLLLTDGGVAVLDGQAAEIRLFDSAGAYRMSLGSKGQGPGELQSPSVLALLSGDTLAVYDERAMRIARFGPNGKLGRITTLEATRTRIVAASFLPDGRLVGQSRWLAPNAGPLPGEEPTFVRDTAVLMLFTTAGALGDTIDVLPGSEAIQSIEVRQRSVSVTKRAPVFGRTNVVAAHPEGVWSSTNDRFELHLREAGSGRLIHIIRAPGLEQPATDELAKAIHDRALAEARTDDDRRGAEEWFAMSPRPASLPAYDRIVVDDHARLWVRA